jgi:hypothetical protein
METANDSFDLPPDNGMVEPLSHDDTVPAEMDPAVAGALFGGKDDDTDDPAPDNAADEPHSHDDILVAAAALTKGDHAGAMAVIADAVLADIDPVLRGALFAHIKTSTGIPVGDIRKQFEKMAGVKKSAATTGRALPFAFYQPASAVRPLKELLDEVADFIRARVSCSENEINVAALWSVATWGVREGVLPGQEANGAPGPSRYPRLRVMSGGPGSGKTTLMETLSYIAARALGSPAAPRALRAARAS